MLIRDTVPPVFTLFDHFFAQMSEWSKEVDLRPTVLFTRGFKLINTIVLLNIPHFAQIFFFEKKKKRKKNISKFLEARVWGMAAVCAESPVS